MRFGPYKQVLGLPGMRPLMLLAIVARIPVVAVGITLTLYVVLDLHRGYGAAGALGATYTLASAVGAPLLGRLVDKRSLRAALGVSIAAEAVFWSVAPQLSYAALLPAAALLGLLTMPVFSVVRQSIAALVPASARRPAYAIDSMTVELSFMIGPAAAVLLITQFSATATMYVVGAAVVLSGIGLFVQNPPVRTAEEDAEVESGERVPRLSWLRPRFLAVLVLTAATTAVLAATDITVVAQLREAGQVGWVGLVMAFWAGYSMVGGFVYGALRSTVPTALLVALLGLFTIPISLVDGVFWLVIALVPAGALCAPSLASSADAVSRLVPASARGEAMGLYGSALTLGLAGGAPLAGVVVDAASPAWGFVVVGTLTLVMALVTMPFARTPAEPEAEPVREPKADPEPEPRLEPVAR